MFREEQEELTRLQEALLEEPEEIEEIEEEPEEEIEETEEEFEDFEALEEEPEEKGVTGLLITALLLTLGIVGVAIWVLVDYGFL